MNDLSEYHGAILFFHLLAVGIWAGCIAIEVVCELGQKHAGVAENYIATLHWNIDRFVEIPAIIVTLATGILLYQNVAATPLLQYKIYAGAAAIVLNSVAAYTVYRRYQAFAVQDESRYLYFHRLHERVGIGCVASITTAIVLGGMHFSL
ncbi:MAG: hypothetical protein AseanaTS_03410 [Candidatus Pelagadaptatus aseana]|uniref:hypothetical protein n=1 Tax=Candidatus Pelagadaptatus aseana TaxID=3120508 RepID=UPI0039B19DD0